MYPNQNVICLTRKKYKIVNSLGIIKKVGAGMLKLVDRHA
ncbi:MAG: hypothetical protein UX91_C0005G0037 [Candidatus Amesbacteria bacterium GW2011_GWB1_47_19]|nr:MAG: hypothetical protein UW51_C0007G0037 [Candidatus Amesbacteria bacterium GW2011_GWA1_44_24]KKU31119.1 MAG: hypothetical protein UX46_C0007G0037 [Candidatus Amesbacteria bacterium GW2011_GWC1_46_24]KKU67240.1 MAG: hypothetical protein UX91_C0005G0037 [Candidatus Amesbacteria bacterium GW2011_GWB1_47_19]